MRHYIWALLVALVVMMGGVEASFASLLPSPQADTNQQDGPDDGPDGEF